MDKHSCVTCFSILGDFDFDLIISELKLEESVCEKKRNKLGETSLKIGKNEIYDVNINNMLRVTLKDLFNKLDVLNELKEKYNLEYYLEMIPHIVSNSKKPKQILSLEEDIIEFIYKTKTILDLDYYVY